MNTKEMTGARKLSLEACAERTDTTVRFWRRMAQERRIRTYKVGKFVRISEADLEEWLSENSRPAREL